MKRKTTDQFKKEVYDKVQNEYIVLSEYINCKTKIKMKHTSCNNEYLVNPSEFLKGTRCPYCAKNQRKTTEQFKKEVYDMVKDEYIILGSYINNKSPILMKHILCNYEFKVSPNDFLSHLHRCPYCNGGSLSTNKDIFNKKFKKYSEDFILLNDYVDIKIDIKLKHKKCNTIITIKPDLFFRKKCKCPTCDNNKKSHNEFINEISNLVDLDEYIPLSEYTGYRNDFKFLHKKCNKIYNVKPYRFLQGDRCPYCKRSKGEDKIIKWLESNNIEYEQYYTFKDLFYKSKNHPLTFDIRILCENPNDYILIEYDGEFHERNIYYEDNFINQVERDKLKDQYCSSHDNIDFYRINYRDYDIINDILNEIINKYN